MRRQPKFRRSFAIVACVLAVAVGSAGAETVWIAGATVDCCCGAHDADQSCHCPDCPVVAARRHDDRSRSGDPAGLVDGIGQCGQDRSPAMRAPGVDWDAARVDGPALLVWAVLPPERGNDPPPPSRVVSPESPPS